MSIDAYRRAVAAPLDLTAGLTTPGAPTTTCCPSCSPTSEREIRDRVRNFVDTQVLPIINDYWERGAVPVRTGPEDRPAGRGRRRDHRVRLPRPVPARAGMVTLELSRGDGSVNTFLGVQNGLAMGSINMLGSRGAEAALAAGDGPAGQGRRVRADRTRPRLRLRRAGNHRPPGRRPLGAQRRQAVDRQRQHRARRHRLGPGRRRRQGQGLRGGEGGSGARGHDRLPGGVFRRTDHREDRQTSHLATRHHPDQRAGAGREQAGRGQLVPRRRPGC